MRSFQNAIRRMAMDTRLVFAFLSLLALGASTLKAAPANPPVPSGTDSSDPRQRVTDFRQGTIPTQAGLRLTVRAQCADVQILTDSSDSVTYLIQTGLIQTGSKSQADAELLEGSVRARQTLRGVALLQLPQPEPDCRDRITYIIHVPRRYDLDVAVQSGDITVQEIDGAVSLSTGGGEIQAAAIGTGGAGPAEKGPGRKFLAQLETAGGDICVKDVAGGLRAETAGGQISAADVHGPAVLRTGGGDIHVAHVFGAAHFMSGGGDIVAQKIDGAVWADTGGGRIQIGNVTRSAALVPQFAPDRTASFAAVVPGDFDPQRTAPPDGSISSFDEIIDLGRLLDALVWGGIRVNPADQQKRLITAVAPEYPDVARLAGIEGDVTLRIVVGRDGIIHDALPLSGPPVLARASLRALEKWRYAPALLDERPVNVITTVTLAFRLRP